MLDATNAECVWGYAGNAGGGAEDLVTRLSKQLAAAGRRYSELTLSPQDIARVRAESL